MSVCYRMFVTIDGFQPGNQKAIEAALRAEWDFDGVDELEGVLTALGESSLSAGLSEEEFSERLAKAVWQANGGFCRVQVDATDLEHLPYNEYPFDEASYGRLIRTAPARSDGDS